MFTFFVKKAKKKTGKIKKSTIMPKELISDAQCFEQEKKEGFHFLYFIERRRTISFHGNFCKFEKERETRQCKAGKAGLKMYEFFRGYITWQIEPSTILVKSSNGGEGNENID